MIKLQRLLMPKKELLLKSSQFRMTVILLTSVSKATLLFLGMRKATFIWKIFVIRAQKNELGSCEQDMHGQ